MEILQEAVEKMVNGLGYLNSERKKKNFIPPMAGQRIYKEGNKKNRLFSLELLFESTVSLGFKAQRKILSDFRG